MNEELTTALVGLLNDMNKLIRDYRISALVDCVDKNEDYRTDIKSRVANHQKRELERLIGE